MALNNYSSMMATAQAASYLGSMGSSEEERRRRQIMIMLEQSIDQEFQTDYGFAGAVLGEWNREDDKKTYSGNPGCMKPVEILKDAVSVSGEEINNRIKMFVI